jgi:hypothetical protein
MSWNITGAPGTGEDLLYSQAGTPTLDLRFASSKNLNDYVSGQNLITFSRGSDRSIITSAGGMDVIGSNLAGFSHDPFTLESLGLHIEELRSNLLLNSAAPASQNITVAATTYTLSFYGSGDIVLTGAHSATVIGTGAFPNRQILTFTPTAGTLGVAVSGTVEFANLEPGSFATSWIPTTGSTATRNADAALITGTNFSRWYSQSAGTSLVEFREPNRTTVRTPRSFSDGTSTNRWDAFNSGAATINNRVVIANVQNNPGTGTLLTGGALNRHVLAVGSPNAASAVNGTLSTASTSSLVPTVNRLIIGADSVGATPLTGHIRRLAYFDRRLPDATLQAITA